MKRLGLIGTLLLPVVLLGCLPGLPIYTAGEVPFVPTPPEVIDRMLELAEIKVSDVVYDVGSGDGRIVIRAAKKYGVKAVGIEIDRELVETARAQARAEGVAHLVAFREEDALDADISEAAVVMLYMMPEFNAKLAPKLRKLKSGARVVAHDFGIEGWSAIKIEKMASETGFHVHTIYLWKLP